MLIAETATHLGLSTAKGGSPIALGISMDAPELPVRDVGLAATNPANLFHFVTHPAVGFVP
jgi:hypothetical protein